MGNLHLHLQSPPDYAMNRSSPPVITGPTSTAHMVPTKRISPAINPTSSLRYAYKHRLNTTQNGATLETASNNARHMGRYHNKSQKSKTWILFPTTNIKIQVD